MKALFAVLCLTTVSWRALGQPDSSMVNMPMPTPSMSMPMPMMSGPAPQPTDVPTNATFNSVGMNMMFNSVVSARTAAELNEVYDPNAGVDGVSRFDNSLSSNIRRSYYFNCVEKNSRGSTTFPTANQLENNVLSIYFQMPVLFYLDFEIRAGLMLALRSATGSSNLCIYRHQDMRVSYFEEGVLLSVFDSNTARGSANLNGEALRSNFMTGRTSAGFTSFLGKSAINLAEPSLYTNGVIPAPLAARNGDSGDFTMSPTAVRQHAMIIHYVVGCPDLFDVADTIISNAAENPNAINFYLVAGDYVFIVIGSILSFSVLVLVVIGFFVHPYFLG